MNTFQCKNSTATAKRSSKSTLKSVKKNRSDEFKKNKSNKSMSIMDEILHLTDPSHNVHVHNKMPLQQRTHCNQNSNILYQSQSHNQYLQQQQMICVQRQHEMQSQHQMQCTPRTLQNTQIQIQQQQQHTVKQQNYTEHYSAISNATANINQVHHHQHQHQHQQQQQQQQQQHHHHHHQQQQCQQQHHYEQIKITNNMQYNMQFNNNIRQEQQQHIQYQQQPQQQQQQESPPIERSSRPIIESVMYFSKHNPMLKIQQNPTSTITASDTANNVAVSIPTTTTTTTAAAAATGVNEIVHSTSSIIMPPMASTPMTMTPTSMGFEEIIGRTDKIGPLLEMTGIKEKSISDEIITTDMKEQILHEITNVTDNLDDKDPDTPAWYFDMSELVDPIKMSAMNDSGVVVICAKDKQEKQQAAAAAVVSEIKMSFSDSLENTDNIMTTTTATTGITEKTQVDGHLNDYSEFYYIDDANTKQYNKIQENQVTINNGINVPVINNNSGNNTINTLNTNAETIQQQLNYEIPCISLINLQEEIDKTQICKFDLLKQKSIDAVPENENKPTATTEIGNTVMENNDDNAFKVSILNR
ncbi:putative protein 4 [Mauternbach virus]|uniref:Uncharacterized protein n=1 Tax=Mauternbach virus TaxID=2486603 RepID=A0A3G3E610_9VIRU|nr:putative protein 4 [Mauternbach virus]AYP97906.1 putative protein 4 [Mauternbach virus]